MSLARALRDLPRRWQVVHSNRRRALENRVAAMVSEKIRLASEAPADPPTRFTGNAPILHEDIQHFRLPSVQAAICRRYVGDVPDVKMKVKVHYIPTRLEYEVWRKTRDVADHDVTASARSAEIERPTAPPSEAHPYPHHLQ